jgi:hypothetical protein
VKERNVTNHPTKSTLEMMELISSREEIESAIKYLKNNKAELLKNGGPYLVDALEHSN